MKYSTKTFHVVDRRWTAAKCTKMKEARAKRAKLHFLVVNYANFVTFLSPLSAGLLKLYDRLIFQEDGDVT